MSTKPEVVTLPLNMYKLNAVVPICWVLLTGCGGSPRPVSTIAEDFRRTAPPGWHITTSNAEIHIESVQQMSFVGRVSRPAGFSMEEFARDYGHRTNYHVILSFMPRLRPAEMERLRQERAPFEHVLDHGARSKAEYGEATRGYESHPVPVFFTDDYSIFVARPMDRFTEVYPPEAAAEVQELMSSLKKTFQQY